MVPSLQRREIVSVKDSLIRKYQPDQSASLNRIARREVKLLVSPDFEAKTGPAYELIESGRLY